VSSVGVRELRKHTGEILRRVRENNEEIQVTYHGRVIARLLPMAPPRPAPTDLSALWSDLDRLAAEIGTRWPAGVTAAEAVSEGRREL
jgi:prevent-host-death family protein